MRIKVSIIIMCFTIMLGIFVQQQFAYPQVWNDIHIGMSYQEVVDRVGEPMPYMYEKGPFWTQYRLTGRQELWMYFSNKKVCMMSIKSYFGTQKHFLTETVSYENNQK